MEAYGRHLLVEMWDCNREILDDAERITQIMRNAATDAGATVIKSIYHEFNPPGITAVAILSESHISVHTWPIEGYVAVDIFTCGTVADPQLQLMVYLRVLDQKSILLWRLRGVLHISKRQCCLKSILQKIV